MPKKVKTIKVPTLRWASPCCKNCSYYAREAIDIEAKILYGVDNFIKPSRCLYFKIEVKPDMICNEYTEALIELKPYN